ncbi:MAG TPA: GAF domain-containing sensor histidine kinase, partial [Aggregatilineales bacterium]|nr:GAF domain-containing sensor histidine kinase [Aggregatilineales bacterium]
IVLHDPDSQSLVRAFFLEDGERLPEHEGERWPDDEGLVAEIIRTGRPIRTADYRAECVRRGIQPRESRHLAWMGVPLNTGARTGGVMVVASYDPAVTFSDDQLKVFWAIADQAATALDKARLFNETETRARQLATLNEIATELSSTLNVEGVLERIMRAAVEIIGVEAGSLLLLDEASGELVYRMVEGGKRELVGTRLPLGVGVVSEAVEARRPVIMNGASQVLLAVPLLVQDRSIGVLELINRRDGAPFDDDDSALLWTFAAQAAVAIDNARLYEATDAELARRVDELQNLQRLDRELNRTLDLDRVAQTTLDWAVRQTGAEAGLVGLLNGDEGLDVLASRGADGRLPEPGTPYPLDGGIAGRAIATGQPELVTGDGAGFAAMHEGGAPSQIAVPIRHGESVTGLLLLERPAPGGFTEADFDFAQRLVEHAAVAIENARLVQEVRDANRSKTEFISFVSHELKNPMTSIRGYTDLLRSGQVGEISEMQEQFLGTIRANVDRMTRLVTDLSDIARIESGRLRLELEPVAVGGIVDETLRALEAQIEEKQQQVDLQVEDGLPPLRADYTRMVQVLTNLVSNAHKYTPEGGLIEIGARLEIATHEESGETQEVVHHWVRDTGIGMSADELDQLFTKFFRTPQAKDMAPGTGLGLNITRSLVEQHGGAIWVESAPGEGSTFHYIIPTASTGEATD